MLKTLRMRKRVCAAATLFLGFLGVATNAQAETVSYYLDQSNELADGVNYLQVTISDGADGAIDFEVTILEALSDIASDGFGLVSFGFNTTGAANSATEDNIVGLPDGWSVDSNNNQDGFGTFELIAEEHGAGDRVSPTLSFSIVGVSGDTVYDYLVLSSGNADEQGNQFFAAHVAGFDDPNSAETSAYFGGLTPVPVPAAVWLLGSALLCFASIGHRRPHVAGAAA